MGVRIPRIDFEFLKQLATESILWQHAFYGKSNQILRSFFLQVFSADGCQPADITAVAMVELLIPFASCQGDLFSVDHHDPITGIDMRRKGRVMLAPQMTGHFCGQTPKDSVLGVDNIPFALIVRIFCN